MSEWSDFNYTVSARGLRRYQITIWHDGLNKYQIVRGASEEEVKEKANRKMADWDEMWERKQAAEEKKLNAIKSAQVAEERTAEAKKALSELEEVLTAALKVDSSLNWETLKDSAEFSDPKPAKLPPPEIEKEPKEAYYQPKLNILDKLISSWKEKKIAAAKATFEKNHQEWEEHKRGQEEDYRQYLGKYAKELKAWEERKAQYYENRKRFNEDIDKKRAQYEASDPEAITDCCELVLSRSEYPDYFPQSFETEYNPENKILVVDYQLPSLADIPTLSEVKYVKTRNDFTEKHISQSQLNKLYDALLYQIALRSVHELYEADKINALSAVGFNGLVKSIDAATGKEVNACVLSLQANKEEFSEFNLSNVEPKACFKKLKGVGSSKLHSMTPVAPLLQIDRSDKRFVASYEVVDGLQESENLAAMDWEDFEHLIRELFEKEFAKDGGEVKVTRASRDGGVDAIVFDPDPLRGGKIVIQAKRYTNTVGVAAVRDLYGTVVNEGANKGILVSTSDYGPDAYQFAKGKPLVLLNGGNLLHLLEKHGTQATIDLKEAKKILAEQDKEKA